MYHIIVNFVSTSGSCICESRLVPFEFIWILILFSFSIFSSFCPGEIEKYSETVQDDFVPMVACRVGQILPRPFQTVKLYSPTLTTSKLEVFFPTLFSEPQMATAIPYFRELVASPVSQPFSEAYRQPYSSCCWPCISFLKLLPSHH